VTRQRPAEKGYSTDEEEEKRREHVSFDSILTKYKTNVRIISISRHLHVNILEEATFLPRIEAHALLLEQNKIRIQIFIIQVH
jgi:hypothetical protein